MGKLKLQLFAKSVEELAKEVIAGKHGNGATRKTSTNNTTTTKNTTPKVAGVDSSLVETITSSYTPDADTKKAEQAKNESANAYKEHASNTDIISQSTWDAINKQWETPASVLEADKFLSSQLEQIRSGRTSYTDQVEELFNKYMNREDFEYDVSEDQLFQQALASAMSSGKSAMQDTIGQASALTGGYGSTYATSAGNQAYNSFIEDAYNNLPEYYNMALQAYQMEGEEMLQQFNMASTLDAQEYARLVDSYNAGVDERNWQYNTAFNEWSAGVTNAYNSANLQLNENAQIGNNLYNTYLVEKDAYETKYSQGYQSWLDSVNSASTIAGLQNSDYWSQTEFDEQVRQYNEQFAYQKERDAVADSQWAKSYALEQQQVANSNKTEYYENLIAEMEEEYSGYMSPEDQRASQSDRTSTFKASILTPNEFKRRGGTTTMNGKQKSYDNYNQYVSDAIEKNYNDGNLTEQEVAYLVKYYGIQE